MTKKFKLKVMAILAVSTYIQAAEEECSPVGQINWGDNNNPGSFSVAIQNNRTRAQEGPFSFHAIAFEKYRLGMGNQHTRPTLPSLSPQHAANCSTFKARLEQAISEWQIISYTLRYEADLGRNRYLRPILTPSNQQSLTCKLQDFILSVDREKCAFVFTQLRVSVTIDNRIFTVDLLKHLSEWSSSPFTFTDHTPQNDAVICVDRQGRVFKAAGHRRTCPIPALTDIKGYEAQRTETFAHYLSTQEGYNGAVSATLFPVNSPMTSTNMVWRFEYGHDQDNSDYYSEEGSSGFSGWNSLAEGETTTQPYVEPYEFYEVTGTPELILAQHNPFIYFKPGGRAYRTQAYQIRAHRVVGEKVDQSNPFTLQYLVPTDVDCGAHSWPEGWGLRWAIYDPEGFPILPDACQSQPLPESCLKMNIKGLRRVPNETQPLALYNFCNQNPQEMNKALDALSDVFVKTDPQVKIYLGENAEYKGYPIMTTLFSDVSSFSIRELELQIPCVSYTPQFYESIGNMLSLTHLRIDSSDRFFTTYGYSYERNKFPRNLVSLEIYETKVGPQTCGLKNFTRSLSNIMGGFQKQSLPYLKKFLFHSVGSNHMEDAFSVFPEFIKKHPSLEELDLRLSFFDAPFADKPGIHNNVHVASCSIYAHEPRTKFETMWNPVRGGGDRPACADIGFIPAILNSNIKFLHLGLPQLYSPPKGSRITYNNCAIPSYSIVELLPVHWLWTCLMNGSSELRTKKPSLTLIVQS